MPLIFMTMFIWAPSGLVLYWTVSNLWAIGQQVLTNRMIGPAPQRVRSAGGRAAAEERGRRQERCGEGAQVMELHDRVKDFVAAHARRRWGCRSR